MLRVLVERAGGRMDPARPIDVDYLEPLRALFEEWASKRGRRTAQGLVFDGQPGLWHALDELYPLQDPNRWDRLRHAVIASLEERHWTRLSPPRGSAFRIDDST